MHENDKKRYRGYMLQKLRQLPLFWSNLLLMLCLVVLMSAVLILSNHLYEQSLADSYQNYTQSMLEYNSEALSRELYMTYAIPSAMEGTISYNYIRTVSGDRLPQKYATLLPFISQSLRNQQFLLQGNEECLIYLHGSNAICTRYYSFLTAEDCFDEYLSFAQTTPEEIMTSLRGTNVVCLLPAQEVQINGGAPSRQMALVIRPIGARISVMTLYSENTILERLGIFHLPENTYVRICANDGSILDEYPHAFASEPEDCLRILTSLPHLRANVTIWIPRSYILGQTSLARHTGWLMLALMTSLAFILCVVFSNALSRPIRQLFLNHTRTEIPDESLHGTHGVNEVLALADILKNSEDRIDALQKGLLSHLFVRVSNGSVLSEEDEAMLESGLEKILPPWRIAVLHVQSAEELLLLSQQLPSDTEPPCYVAVLNMKEIGVLITDTPEQMERIRQLCRTFPAAACGVSAPFSAMQKMHEAVRQSRICIPPAGGFALFSGADVADPLTWMQHERLYQSIVDMQEQTCIALIRSIDKGPQRHHASELFYTVRFILRSAAAEMDIPLPEAVELEYKMSMLPRENLERLERLAGVLFGRIRQREQSRRSSERGRVLAWLDENFADCNLTTAMVAEQFQMSEKSVYNIVKQVTGQSVQEYILTLRMQQVSHLLRSTQDGILEIAQRCGYPSASTFYRVFKKYYGVTPLQYRENAIHGPDMQNAQNESSDFEDNI